MYKRILVVEDNPDLHVMVRHMLRGAYEFDIAATYEEALVLAGGRRYDLFLIDIVLPGFHTGFDLLGQLRTQPAHRHTPALAFTIFDEMGRRRRFTEAGFDGVVQKPCPKHVLIRSIEAALKLQDPAPSRTALDGKRFILQGPHFPADPAYAL